MDREKGTVPYQETLQSSIFLTVPPATPMAEKKTIFATHQDEVRLLHGPSSRESAN